MNQLSSNSGSEFNTYGMSEQEDIRPGSKKKTFACAFLVKGVTR